MSEQAKAVGVSDKMKAKDYITLGIFTVLFFAVVMVCIFASAATVVTFAFGSAIAAIPGGIIYMPVSYTHLDVYKRQERHLAEAVDVLNEVESSPVMQKLWESYRRKFSYAADLEWNIIMRAVRSLYALSEKESSL